MIISASRRTDIPAFYAEWFMNRVREGFLLTKNPFNAHQVKRVSLLPQDVDAIVFWTRNAEKLLPELPALDSKGYAYYFQYTITGYPRALEKSVPRPERAIDIFKKLSERIGAGRVVWRYDPVLLSNRTELAEHKRLFAKIAAMLSGYTKRVVVSFADLYNKTERNLKAVDNLAFRDITQDEESLLELAGFMAEIGSLHGMEVQTCAEKVELCSLGLVHGKCIDDELLRREFKLSIRGEKDKGQREECGCVKSIDIGQYNTCLHGCAYCYATFSQGLVRRNAQQHDPTSPFLIGNMKGYPTIRQDKEIEPQRQLF